MEQVQVNTCAGHQSEDETIPVRDPPPATEPQLNVLMNVVSTELELFDL